MISITMKQWGYFSDTTAACHKTYALQTKWHTPTPREAVARPLRRVMRDLLRQIEAMRWTDNHLRVMRSPVRQVN